MADDCPSNCPPMPTTDTIDCIPDFLRKAIKLCSPQYKAPEGIEIAPLGVSGRSGNRRPDFNENAGQTLADAGTDCIGDKDQGVATESAIENINDCACESDGTSTQSTTLCEAPPALEGACGGGSDVTAGNINACDAPPASIESDTCEDADPVNRFRQALKTGCDCSLCVKQIPEPECSMIPELDPNDQEPSSVKADRLMDVPCNCFKCTPKGETAEGEDETNECFFPTVTCGECGSTRGQNSSCIMCCFALQMEHERRMQDFTCTACGKLTDTCQKKDPCEKAVDPNDDFRDFELDDCGCIKYEGGMTITRCQYYLWKSNELCEPNGFEELAYIECDDDGCPKPEEDNTEPEPKDCTCAEYMKMLAKDNEVLVDGVALHDYIYAVPFSSPKKPHECVPRKPRKKKPGNHC